MPHNSVFSKAAGTYVSSVLTIIVFVLCAAGSDAQAAPDLTAKLSSDGLEFIGNALPDELPTSHAFSAMSKKLGSCPGDDSAVSVPGPTVTFKVKTVKIVPKTGKLQVTAEVTGVKGSLTAKVNKLPVVCFGGFSCTGNAAVSTASVTASFSPAVKYGAVDLQQPTLDIDVDPADVTLSLSNCGVLGSAANTVLSGKVLPQIKSWVVDQLTKLLEKLALTHLPPLVEEALAGFTSYSSQLQGFKVSGQLEQVTSSYSGLSAGVGLGITPTTSSSCTQSTAAKPKLVTGTPTFAFSGAHVGVGVTRHALAEAMIAAWKSGLLCLPEGKLASLGLSSSMLNVAGIMLGLTSVESIAVNAPKPPQLDLVSGTSARAEITLPGLTITIKGQGPNGATTIIFTLDVVLRAVLELNPVDRSVIIESLTTTVSKLKIEATPSQGLSLSKSVVDTLLTSVVLPVIEEKVKGTRLIPHVLHKNGGVLDPYYLYLVRGYTSASSGHVKFYAKLHEKAAYDKTRPQTKLDKVPPKLLAPQNLQLVASGSDNSTPADLLRFSWRINGGSWTAASYGRGRMLTLKHGSYTVAVRAKDLHGNVDLTPASASFEVDGVQPTLSVINAPSGTVSADPVSIVLAVSDDRSPQHAIGVKVKVSLGGQLEREDPFIDGLSTVSISGLKAGDYAVELTAQDEAGNLSAPQTVSFSYASSASGNGGGSGSGSGSGTGAADLPIAPYEPGAAQDPESDGSLSVDGGCTCRLSKRSYPDADASEGGWSLLSAFLLLLLIRRRRSG
jgi:hypothetical protein